MLELKNISKIYAHKNERVEVIRNFNLSVKDREFVALVGPSGCGKTTLLKIIAGLIFASGGSIVLDEEKILRAGKDRGLVPQSFTLFPWLTVEKNIAFGLSLKKPPEKKKARIVSHYLDITGLKEFADFYPRNLSGGMQQRVAIARTLANEPEILLMDEPFGSLDAQTRQKMQEFLEKIWEREQKTVIFVTHDVEEAIFLADRVIVLSSQPMRIEKELQIAFSRPRKHELKFSEKFTALKKEISVLL